MAYFDTLKAVMELDSTGIESGLKTTMSKIQKIISDPKTGKLDMKKLFDANFNSLNWTTIIGKLFTPANLIAFFSAMAATGIVAAATQQQAAATGTPAGAALTPTQQSGVTAAAQAIANTTGQGTNDVTTAIETLLPALGDNVQAAQTLAGQIAKVAASEGVSTTSVAQSFAPLLQSLGITDLGDATTLLTSFDNAAVQSGQTVSTLIDSWQPFVAQIKEAKLSQKGLNDVVQQFGASVEGAGLTGATAAFQLLFDSITPTANQMAFSNLAGGAKKLKQQVADGQTSGALDAIGGAINSMATSGNLNLINSEFGVNATAIAAVTGNLTKYPIATQQTIDEIFKATNTDLRQFNEALQTFENLAANTFGAPLLAVLTGITDFFIALASNQLAWDSFVTGILALSAASFLGFIGFASSLAKIPATLEAITAAGGLSGVEAAAGAGGTAAAAGGAEVTAGSALAELLGPIAAGTVLALLIGNEVIPGLGNQTGGSIGKDSTTPLAPGVNTLKITFSNMPAGTSVSSTGNMSMLINNLPGGAGVATGSSNN